MNECIDFSNSENQNLPKKNRQILELFVDLIFQTTRNLARSHICFWVPKKFGNLKLLQNNSSAVCNIMTYRLYKR